MVAVFQPLLLNESNDSTAILSAIQTKLEAQSIDSTSGSLRVHIETPTSAYGSVLTASLTPVFHVTFAYDTVNPVMFTTTLAGNGAVSSQNMMGILSISSTVSDYAKVHTAERITYRAGLGSLARFSGIFADPVAESQQLMGPGTDANGFFFGYNGTRFGIMHRRGGLQEHWTLTITGAIQAAVDMTVQLGGVTSVVSFTDAGALATDAALAFTAYEFTKAGVIGAFNVYAISVGGSHQVRFQSIRIGDVVGDFSVTPVSTFAGTFTHVSDGADAEEVWAYQENWSIDPMTTSSGPSGQTIDPQKGNVFSVKYQWLGVGGAKFFIENAQTTHLELVHVLPWANAHTGVSLLEPNVPLMFMLESKGSATAMEMNVGSAAAFIEGTPLTGKPLHAISHSKTISVPGSSENIICIRVAHEHNGISLHSEITISTISVAVDGNKPSEFSVILNPTAIGDGTLADHPNWVPVDSDSFVDYDIDSKTATGGEVVFTGVLAKTDSDRINAHTEYMNMERGEALCIHVSPAPSQVLDASVALSWHELI